MASVDGALLEKSDTHADAGDSDSGDGGRRGWFGRRAKGLIEPEAVKTGLISADVRRGGLDTEVVTTLDRRKAMGACVRDRFGVVEELVTGSAKEDQYSPIDRVLRAKGKEFVNKVDSSSELTREELALVWTIVTDEFLEKTQTAKRMTEVNPGRRIPILGRLSKRLVSEPSVKIATGTMPEITSPYLAKHRFADWSDAHIDADLAELNNLRADLEIQMGFRGSLSDSLLIPDFSRGNGEKFHDYVVDAIPGVLKREPYGGRSLERLQEIDPILAARAQLTAVQEAMIEMSPELAKAVLNAEVPELNTVRIDEHIKLLGEGVKEPDPVDLENAADKVKAAQKALEEAEAKLLQHPTKYEAAEAKVKAADNKKKLADKAYTDNEPIINRAIERCEAEISTLTASLATVAKNLQPGIQASIDKQEATKVAKEDELRKLLSARASAQLEFDQAEKEKTDLGDAKKARKRVKKTREKLRQAKDDERDIKTPNQEANEERAEALGAQKIVGDPKAYAAIIDRRYNPATGHEFSRDKLAKTELNDEGQVSGADLIRKHIFSITEAGEKWFADPKNRELARKMLSDEQIVRAAIFILKIDASRERIVVGGRSYTYKDALSRLKPLRDTYYAAEKILAEEVKSKKWAAGDPYIKGLEKIAADNKADLLRYERPLVNAILPQIGDATQFQIGDMLRFMVRGGLQSSANGNPFLEISDDYLSPEPEIRITSKGLVGEDMGNVEFRDTKKAPEVEWIGELDRVKADFFGDDWADRDPTLKLNFKIAHKLGRTASEAEVFVEMNERLLQFLPVPPTANMPPSLRERFYDKDGMKIEAKALADRWVKLDTDTKLTSDRLLNMLSISLAPDAARKIGVSTANEVLFNMTPAQRREVVKAFHSLPVDINWISGAVDRYMVDYTNDGEFFITNRADPDSREKLETFLEQREEEERTRLGVRELSAAERQFLVQRQDLAFIMGEVGRQIIQVQGLRGK